MAKRNPNNYGCVTKLSGRRSRPYVAKVTVYDGEGKGRQTAIGYAATRAEALQMLAKYNDRPWPLIRDKVSLADLYQSWLKIKYPKLGKANQRALKAAYLHCSKYYGIKYRSLRAYQMQECIDNCGRSYATQSAIKNLFRHLDRFAYEMDLIDKMYSQLITSDPVPETSREPFTEEQVEALWEIADQPWVDSVLIYIYTGFRLTELLNMKCEDINTAERYFKGGVKTESGKDRIIPIHHRIWPFVERRINSGGAYLFSIDGDKLTARRYYAIWKKIMSEIGVTKIPHEARHTFETNLDNAGANRRCIDLLMGHKSKDVGNRVYNHKTIEQLREAVELLP